MKMCSYFEYGKTETEYLKSRDPKLGEVIDRIGFVERPVINDLFESVLDSIIAQQISSKAHKTIQKRLKEMLPNITPEAIIQVSDEKLQSIGTTFKKVSYMKAFAQDVLSGRTNLDKVREMPDDQVIKTLSSIKGIGEWTAEMIMLHCLKRPDILSFKDIAIIRGIKIVYNVENVDREYFEMLRKRFSPYGSVASIYFWAVAGGGGV